MKTSFWTEKDEKVGWTLLEKFLCHLTEDQMYELVIKIFEGISDERIMKKIHEWSSDWLAAVPREIIKEMFGWYPGDTP